MCIICSGEYKRSNPTCIDCSNCPTLESIPDDLTELYKLDCSKCPLLKTISDKLIHLNELICYRCPSLKSIPNLPHLRWLDCSVCPLIREIPDLIELSDLYCSNCSRLVSIKADCIVWNCKKCFCLTHSNSTDIFYSAPFLDHCLVFPKNLKKVKTIQKWLNSLRESETQF